METIPDFAPRVPRRSLEIFLNSLWAFLLREMKRRYGMSRLGLFWGLLDPVMTIGFLLGIHAITMGLDVPIYGAHPLVFFVWGVTAYFMWQHGSQACIGVCNASRGLFNYRQIRPIDIMLAKALLDVLELAAALLLFLGAFAYLGVPLEAENPALLLVLLFAVFFTALSTGLLFEVYGTAFPELRQIFAFAMRPMLFISGLFFTAGSLAPKVQAWFMWNPVLHLVDIAHGASLRGYESPCSLTYVVLVDLVLLVIALAGYRRYMHELI